MNNARLSKAKHCVRAVTVRSTAYSRIKKKQHYEEKLVPLNEEGRVPPLLVAPAEQSLERQRAILEKALSRLSPEYREVLVLFEIERLSYKDIAAALDVPLETVMCRLSRARRCLQAVLPV